MRCSKCGSDNREGRKFCVQCGQALKLACVWRIADFSTQISNSPHTPSGLKTRGGCHPSSGSIATPTKLRSTVQRPSAPGF